MREVVQDFAALLRLGDDASAAQLVERVEKDGFGKLAHVGESIVRRPGTDHCRELGDATRVWRELAEARDDDVANRRRKLQPLQIEHARRTTTRRREERFD